VRDELAEARRPAHDKLLRLVGVINREHNEAEAVADDLSHPLKLSGNVVPADAAA
jgi:hypothetical protein